jgi:hypothetical protein
MLVATHVRVDKADGTKDVFWVDPDGKMGLDGLPLADLPPYGIDKVGGSSTVVVTEGEKAAQALLDAGIPAVGTVTGASATPSVKSMGDLTGKHVVLWADADEVGADHMLRVAGTLNGIAVSLRWVSWPDAHPHDDAFDCLQRHGKDRVLELLKLSGPVPSNADMTFTRHGLGYTAVFRNAKVTIAMSRLRARSGSLHGELLVRCGHDSVPGNGHLLQGEFNASAMGTRDSIAKQLAARAPAVKAEWRDMLEQFCVRVLEAEREGLPFTTVGSKPPRERVPYLLYPALPLNRPTIVFGAGGSGKSSFAAACVTSIASGAEVVKGWRPERPYKVLILDWEADEQEWNDRIAAIAKGAGIAAPEVHYRPCFTPITEQTDDVSKYVREQGIDLIVVDSVGMASPGTREGSDANEGAIRLFQALRVIGITSLLIDHVNKADKRNEKGTHDPYGSVYKSNLARQTFELRREDDEDPENPVGHIALINRKVNAGPLARPIGLRIEYRDDGAMVWHREEVRDAMQASLPASTRVLDYLRAGAEKPAALAEALDINPTTIRSVLMRAHQKGLVVAFADGRYGLAEKSNAA